MGHEFLLAADIVPRHLISPNLHVILVHFPLGIFVFGLFLEVFSFLWKRSTVRIAGRWMLLFGGLLAVPAALSGMDALRDVFDHTGGEGLSADTWQLLHRHLVLASWGAGLAALTTTIAIGLSDAWRKRLYFPILIALIAAASLMGFGSHFGGEGVYLRGMAIALSGKPAQGIEFYAPAQSMHIALAGCAIALSLGALGTSLHRLSTYSAAREDLDSERELEALAVGIGSAPPVPRRVTDDLTVARSLNEDALIPVPRIPSSRFWLLSSLVFLLTLGFGVWLLISVEQSDFDLHNATAASITKAVTDTATASKPLTNNRQGAHIVIGCVLVLLPLFMAGVVRWLARAKWLVGTLCAFMALLIAAEIWLGVLLLFKGAQGPVFKFIDPSDTATTAAPA